ncbi:piggyBac transposable element-derived protein 4-like [Diadema antillarum]|uniref:piggyBac transposable element-derived protein 4-like n=1 Tax=Diadema antillarum TaxID=105358 RepID=UPI003A8B743E
MGVLGKPAIYLYWSTRSILQTPIFGKSITRDRFKDILRYLHFCNNDARPARDDNNRDPLFKIRKYYAKVTAAFQRVFTPGEFVSVDEGMIRFFGRLSFKTYNPQKPAKYGMKAYKVCDQSGYTWKFQLYTGKSNYRWRNHRGLVALVMSMLTGLLHQGRKVFMDNFYTSPTLFLALFRCSTNACGTVRANRRNMPNELNKNSAKLRVGESLFMKGKELLGMIWRDKRVFAMLSTMHDNQFADTGKQDRRTGENIRKPKMVIDYNKHMGSVDVSDFLTGRYADLRRSLKWYKKLVFHLSDLAMTNAYIVFKSVTGKSCTHIDFVLDVIEQLLAEGQMQATDRPKPTSRGKKSSPVLRRDNPTRLEYATSDHWPTEIPSTDKKQSPTRLCEVCKPARKETRYFCPPCEVALHPTCFRPYHTLLHYSNSHEE